MEFFFESIVPILKIQAKSESKLNFVVDERDCVTPMLI